MASRRRAELLYLAVVVALAVAAFGARQEPPSQLAFEGPARAERPVRTVLPSTRRPTTTTSVATTTTTKPLRSATFAFTGDFLLHNRVNSSAMLVDGSYDYRPLLDPIADLIAEVDWAVCHMEVNLSVDHQNLQSYPRFRAPFQIANDAAALGFDSCTTASNHTIDHGIDGALETLGVLEGAGLHVTGTARSAEEAATRPFFEVNGISVAHFSYTYWFNGLRLPDSADWLAAEIDQERILRETSAAREAGAEYIIVSLHWGDQYVNQPNRQQRELAPVLAASPNIDLIIGHHAHVVQPIEKIGETWVVYGMGNLLANYRQSVRRDELLVSAAVTETTSGGFSTELTAVPLFVDWDSLVVYAAGPESRPTGLSPALNDALNRSYDRTVALLDTPGLKLG